MGISKDIKIPLGIFSFVDMTGFQSTLTYCAIFYGDFPEQGWVKSHFRVKKMSSVDRLTTQASRSASGEFAELVNPPHLLSHLLQRWQICS